ncbi:THAP domain-containing protein 4 [Elysia marginata]|uniref:THAP domain-containing protein 4 n=1 Tax=Elysia marginata TaxID=1093978 RepID=A0AAV4GAG3_9GAST|nr:THAP domain-containing protein 4 [Elysia marginata]
MLYWKGTKQTQTEQPQEDFFNRPGVYNRPGPSKKLSLEQEFFLVMLRLRMGLIVQDLAFRFQISCGLVSQIFTTWVKLLCKEYKFLVLWPSKPDIRQSLPESFKRYYPKTRAIIDCTEVYMETPSSLDTQAMCWSDYKHHCTLKFLVAISPTGLITYISKAYGGRASDKFIVEDSGFLDLIEPYDQIMEDRGFKIRDSLANLQATLTIPPSCRTALQMRKDDVTSTSRIANVRIYVEQAINRIKWYRILSGELELTLLPLCDDIITICAAFCNLLDPLTV